MSWTVGDDYNKSGLEADFTNIDANTGRFHFCPNTSTNVG